MKRYQERIFVRILFMAFLLIPISQMTLFWLLLAWATPVENHLDYFLEVSIVNQLLSGIIIWIFVFLYFVLNLLFFEGIHESIEIWRTRKEDES